MLEHFWRHYGQNVHPPRANVAVLESDFCEVAPQSTRGAARHQINFPNFIKLLKLMKFTFSLTYKKGSI